MADAQEAPPPAGPPLGADAEDDDDDLPYEEVAVEDEPVDEDDDVSEDLDSVMNNLRLLSASGRPSKTGVPTLPEGQRLPSVDDFLRNFLVRAGLRRTLDTFETEWYEAAARGALPGSERGALVPEVYVRNQELESALRAARADLDEQRELAQRATSTWDKFRKERDFHRMHHKRISQEKSKLLGDIKRLQVRAPRDALGVVRQLPRMRASSDPRSRIPSSPPFPPRSTIMRSTSRR